VTTGAGRRARKPKLLGPPAPKDHHGLEQVLTVIDGDPITVADLLRRQPMS
jgi:hypothetical protein